MKPITIHSGSALFGAAIVGGLGLLSSMRQTQVRPVGGTIAPDVVNVRFQEPLDVHGILDPRAAVIVREGVPYTVPPGKLLVVTAIGPSEIPLAGAGTPVRITVNGAVECELTMQPTYSTTVQPVPPGFTVAAGSIVEIAPTIGNGLVGRAWGYLVDA
jgi:hypothetical protein